MGNFPLPASSGAGVLSLGVAPPVSEPLETQPTEASRDVALLGLLREAATTGPLSSDAILNALADAARILSGADGTAIASRNDEMIVCRARSGDMAPSLGAPLNSDSGISGECLRTASIQICNDASTDARVDSEACQALGIRSVAVVPLRGRVGLFGILEAFSGRTDAFEEEQINALRSLAEIAEMAYERERSAVTPAPATSTARAALFPAADRDQNRARFFRKRYLLIGGSAVALLAMAWIARISWWQTGAEIAASTSTVQTASNSTDPSKLQLVAIAKPDASVPAHSGERTRSRAAENTGAPDEGSDTPSVLMPPKDASSSDVAARSTNQAGEVGMVSAPPVQAALGSFRDQIPILASEKAPLPQFGGTVSQGIVPATALDRVNPIYPPQARSHGIGGDVILEATIAENGSVRKITVVSGPRSLTNSAMTAVRQWRFSPALLNGKPIEVQQQITIVFKLP